MSWILAILWQFAFHEMHNPCIFKKPRIWQVFWYMTWYGKNMRKKYRRRQVLWVDALIQLTRKTGERNPGVRKGKRSLLASHIRCKCSMETTHNSVKVKLGIKVMKLVESLIGREVTVGQGSECHLTFVRGLLHIAQQDPRIDHKTSWMTISSVSQGIPVWVAYWKVAWPSE